MKKVLCLLLLSGMAVADEEPPLLTFDFLVSLLKLQHETVRLREFSKLCKEDLRAWADGEEGQRLLSNIREPYKLTVKNIKDAIDHRSSEYEPALNRLNESLDSLIERYDKGQLTLEDAHACVRAAKASKEASQVSNEKAIRAATSGINLVAESVSAANGYGNKIRNRVIAPR